MPNTIKFYRRNLPHWLVTDHSCFVAIRLKGTLPKAIVAELKQERKFLVSSGANRDQLDDLGQFNSLANAVLGRSGPFWAREQFDHWIRSREKFESTLLYIVRNPVKAPRAKAWNDWPWTVVDESVRELLSELCERKPPQSDGCTK